MGLMQLPTELHIEIFSYLQNTDLKAARAVSRTLRDNASPILFRSVVACARYLALEAFEQICHYSVFAKYVKEIVFDGSLYIKRYADYPNAYADASDQLAELRTPSSWDKRTEWQRYQDLYNDQVELQTGGILLHTVSRALDWTKNLSCIVYSPRPHLIPWEGEEVGNLLSRGLAQRPHLERASWMRDYVAESHPFWQLIRAIYISKYTGIHELRVEAWQQGRPGTEFTLDSFQFVDSTELNAAKYVFEGLRSCKLHIARIWWLRRRSISTLANLRFLLGAASDLRHLELHFDNWPLTSQSKLVDISKEDHTLFMHLGPRGTWQKLRSISLGCINADQDDLLDFTRRHKSTLASLHLHCCLLKTGHWADIADEVVLNTRIEDFTLKLVSETQNQATDEGVSSASGAEALQYEGRLEISSDGKRSFMNTDPAKKSVYHWRTPVPNTE